MSSRLRLGITVLTVAVDGVAAALAFFLSYRLREVIPFPTPLRLGPFRGHVVLLVLYVISILLVFFSQTVPSAARAVAHRPVLSLLSAVSIGVIVSTSSPTW